MSRYMQIGRRPSQANLWFACELANKIGPAAAARRIGISRSTLAAVVAGFPVAASTDALLSTARRAVMSAPA